MDIAEKIEDAKQSDALLLIVFYTDWSPHYEWIYIGVVFLHYDIKHLFISIF